MHDSDRPHHIRGFLLGILLALLLGLGGVAWLNWWVNPILAFDHPPPPRLVGLQSTALLKASRSQQIRVLIRQARHADGKILLLGASQSLYGMETCSTPNLQRLSLLGLNDAEVVQILTAAIPALRSPTQIFIVRGIPGKAPPLAVDHGIEAWWEQLFRGRTTQLSVLDLLAARAPAPLQACAPLPYDLAPSDFAVDTPFVRSLRALNDQLEAAAMQGLVQSILPLCRTLRHRMVLVTLPLFFTSDMAPDLKVAMDNIDHRTVANLPSVNGAPAQCEVSTRDLALPYLQQYQTQGAPPSDWYDAVHFKPALGQRLLKEMLEH